MPQFRVKIFVLSLLSLAAVTALPLTGQAQYGVPLMPRGIQPWMEQLAPNQRSAFLKLFTDLGSTDSAGSVNVALLSEDWNRVMTAISGDGSVARTEAWCHLSMVVYKELLDKAGYLQATTLAKLIFSDGFTVLESLPGDNYGQWADFCRMKSYEMQQYTTLHGADNRSVEMTQTFLDWGKKYPGFWARYQNELSGGVCPTFIQPPAGGTAVRLLKNRTGRGLTAAIAIPSDGCLLSSDIPIYGVAGGKGFQSYRVEYGAGRDPDEWHVIAESETPRDTFSMSQVPDLLEGDLDLRGNLATWNVGLRNWEHLPWHPASDTTDFAGVYTIRLSTVGRGGERAEDRVVCEIGRAVAQCLPGTAVSADRKVTLRFQEQSLTAPFRVYTIRPATGESPALPAAQRLIGEVYRVREGGDRFIRPVTLEMSYAAGIAPPSSFGIFTYDAEKGSWLLLGTARDDHRMVLSTELTALGAPRAYFAVLSGTEGSVQSGDRPEAGAPAGGSMKRSGGLPLMDDFETGLGGWSGRGPGTSVVRVFDKTWAVRITKKPEGGNLACNVVSAPFDASEFPLVSFDYRVERDTKADFFVRAGGRWYDIGFTGAAADYRNKDVNIVYAGRIPGIVPDGLWHHAGVDLGHLLSEKTRNTLVEEIILADWKAGGYMKLEFGGNAEGASVLFDNFAVARDTVAAVKHAWSGDSVMIADFENGGLLNLLGGSQALFSSPGTNNCSVEFTDRVSRKAGGGRSLLIRYDIRGPGEYCGWLTTLEGADLKSCTSLRFDIYAGGPAPECLIGLKDTRGREVKVPVAPYLGPQRADGWRQASVPMTVFTGLTGSMENLSVSFQEKCGSGAGSIQVDNIRFRRGEAGPEMLTLDDFEGGGLNALGAGAWTFRSGAATIRAKRMKRPDGRGHAMMISYGGSIGLDLGREGFSYAGWVSGLGGIDISAFDSLQLSISGSSGTEEVNVYLDDGNRRWPVKAACQGAGGGPWRRISIPLREYAVHGVDLTHADGLEFVFEWKEMSGTLLVDDISLVRVKKELLLTQENHGGNR